MKLFLENPCEKSEPAELAADNSRALPIGRAPRQPCPPLSFEQERLWTWNELDASSATFHMPEAWRIQGPLNTPALEQSLNEIIRRHESLRTTFGVVDQIPVQRIAPTLFLPLALVDLQAASPKDQAAAFKRICDEEVFRKFDLAQGPLVRWTLLRFGPDEHVLVTNKHHLVWDEWSGLVFARELSALYHAFARGEPSPLQELPVQYADFAHWQRTSAETAALKARLEQRDKKLGQTAPALQLYTDHSRPAHENYRGAVELLEIDASFAQDLQRFSWGEGTTLSITLLAAFKALLAIYSNQEEILVGAQIANRGRTETEGLIGFFANVLGLRTDLSGNPSFREVLWRVREAVLDTHDHPELPLESLAQEMHLKRSGILRFEVMFVLHNIPKGAVPIPGLNMTSIDIPREITKSNLTLFAMERSEGLSIGFEFNSVLFARDTIRRMLEHYKLLLEKGMGEPDRKLQELDLLTGEERRQVLGEWNSTDAEYPRDTCIHQLFEAQVERSPEAVAAEFESERLNYRELNQRANQLAERLRLLGVGPEVLVGLCVDRSIEMLVALLAVLKAGGAYLPLDPAFPRERLAFILQDAQISVLVTQSHLLRVLPMSELASEQPSVVCLDTSDSELPLDGPTALSGNRKNPQPENLAYVLYTSGSTGKPKGAEITHRAMVNFLTAMLDKPGLTADDVVLAITTLSFDIAGLELLLPLTCGARVVIATRETAANGLRLAEILDRSRATVLQATPTTWRLLLQAEWPGNPKLKLLCGGEALPPDLVAPLLQRGACLWNLYGPTETTVWSSAIQVQPDQPIVIGPPIANTQFYILNSHRRPVPIGAPGELCIGGDGLARGYLRRPELTAEKFVPDPFRNEPGARLYRTGDLARYCPNGQIQFLGRIDHQVKIHGLRVELGEIENALTQHPEVRQSVVIVREHPPGHHYLAAYVVLESSTVTNRELRTFLQEKLPPYMVPSSWMILDKLPLLPNGKLDRRNLPEPPPEEMERESEFVAPRDALELQLAHIWQQVLRLDRVGVKNSFFDLGGSSLLAVRLFVQIEKTLGRMLPASTLFQAATIERLAEILRQDGWAPSWSSLVPIQASGTKPPLYCVHGFGGTVLEYADLARYLPIDQPFYGIRAQGLNGKEPLINRVEEIAAYYIKEVRTLQPVGPYYLGGSSFGGLIAYEMAQQLQAQGQKVAVLALFDSYGQDYPKLLPKVTWMRNKLNRFMMRTHMHWQNLCLLRPSAWPRYLSEKAAKGPKRAKRHLKRFGQSLTRRVRWMLLPKLLREQWKQTGEDDARVWGFDMPKSYTKVGQANVEAGTNYVPKPYTGKVTLFRATHQPPGIYEDRTNGWGELAVGDFEIIDVVGYHGLVREPRVRELAPKLIACLERSHQAELKEKKEQARQK